eukprot:8852951-Alexandrium_andersonii.AAC.1
MSASLVGSEMCIRDSAAAVSSEGLPVGRGIAVSAWAVGLHRAPARREPVSYTHLTLPTICSV